MMGRAHECIIYRDTPLIIGATGIESILQNLRMIVETLRFEIPLMRDFAHDGQLVDSPAPLVTARLTAALMDAVARYEPRIEIEGVWLDEERHGRGAFMDGRLTPRIRFRLREGVAL